MYLKDIENGLQNNFQIQYWRHENTPNVGGPWTPFRVPQNFWSKRKRRVLRTILRETLFRAMYAAPVLLFELTHSGLSALFTTGSKPSTWLPPGGLVEQNFRARNFKENWILNLLLSFCLFLSLFFFSKEWLSHWRDETWATPSDKQREGGVLSTLLTEEPWIFRIFDFSIFDFRFWHVDFSCRNCYSDTFLCHVYAPDTFRCVFLLDVCLKYH